MVVVVSGRTFVVDNTGMVKEGRDGRRLGCKGWIDRDTTAHYIRVNVYSHLFP